MSKTSENAMRIFLGSRLMPGPDGKEQRKLTPKEAWELAEKREKERK